MTVDQLPDVLEQEMGRQPASTTTSRRCWPAAGTGRPGDYETLYLCGELDGDPALMFGAPDVEPLGLRAPAAAYVATMARGLRETDDLTDDELVDYLLACRGAAPDWTGRV